MIYFGMYVAHGLHISYPALHRPMYASSIKIACLTAYYHLSSNKPQVIVTQLLFFHCIAQCGRTSCVSNQVHESTQVNIILHGSLTFFIEEDKGSCWQHSIIGATDMHGLLRKSSWIHAAQDGPGSNQGPGYAHGYYHRHHGMGIFTEVAWNTDSLINTTSISARTAPCSCNNWWGIAPHNVFQLSSYSSSGKRQLRQFRSRDSRLAWLIFNNFLAIGMLAREVPSHSRE